MVVPTPRPQVSALERYHSPQVDVPVRLNTNESPFAPPEEWLAEVAAEAGRARWNRYPDRSAVRLRTEIARRHGVDPTRVFAANGSNEVLQTLLLCFAGPGRTVTVFEPTYQLHSHIARTLGSDVVAVPRRPDFTLTADDVRAAVRPGACDVVFLCSPNNPTGVCESRETVIAAAEAAADAGALLIIDEAYAEFSDWSALELISGAEAGAKIPADIAANVVVSRTFSKTWSLAALRLGYCVAAAEVVECLDAAVLPYHLDAFKQAAGLAALAHDDQMHVRVAAIVAERERVVTAMTAMPLTQWRSGANFVLFRPERREGGLWQAMVDRGVLVRDCGAWPGLEGCLRVTVGTPEENDAFLDALSSCLGEGQ